MIDSRGPGANPVLVVAGLVSSTLVAIGACAPGNSITGSWGWGPADAVGDAAAGPGGALAAVGVTGLVVAWWLARPGAGAATLGLRTAALWALPLLLVPPVMSRDAFAYADIGWMVHVGADLDHDALASQGGPYADRVDPFWAGKLVVYPELAVRLAHLAAASTGYDSYWGAMAQRGVAVVAFAAAAALLLRLAAALGVDPGWTIWCGVLNPLLLIHLVGGGHNDAPMIAVTLLALYVAARWGPGRWWVTWLVAPAVVGVAAAIKPQALVAIVPIMLWPAVARLRSRSRMGALPVTVTRVLGGTVVAVAVLSAIGLTGGRSFGWLGQIVENGESPAFGPALVVAETISRSTSLLGISAPWAVDAGVRLVTLVVLAVCGWLFLTRPDRPLEVAAWTALLVAAGSAILVPWHLCLGLVLLALVRPATRTTYVALLLVTGYFVSASYLETVGLWGPVLVPVALAASAALFLVDRALGRPATPWLAPSAGELAESPTG